MKNKMFILSILLGVVFEINAQSDNIKLYKALNKSASIYTKGNYKKLCKNDAKTILLDSISNIVIIDSLECIIAKVDNYYFNDEIGEGFIITSKWHIYNLSGKKIISESIEIMEIMGADEKNYILIPSNYTRDKRMIILQQENGGYGVIDISKGMIVPFLYKEIKISNDQRTFIAYENDSEKEFIFDMNGKKIK
jgi:hypothetical protein